MYCICCKKNNVKVSLPVREEESQISTEEDILWKVGRRPDGSLVNVNNEMIDNGIIHIIDAGYGSKHDGDQFVIAICDKCIKTNLEDATLLYYGNYMFATEEFVEQERETSKQRYRRRKNLDDLT
jgi:hypothetical protein